MEKLFEEIWKKKKQKQEASRDKNKICQIISTHCVKMIEREKLREYVFNSKK